MSIAILSDFKVYSLISNIPISKAYILKKHTLPTWEKYVCVCVVRGAGVTWSHDSLMRYSVALISFKRRRELQQPALADLTKKNIQPPLKCMSFL